MKTFMLGCWFSLEAYVKNVRKKATKCSLKATEALFDGDAHVSTLPKLDIYQLTVVPNCFKSHINS